MQDNIAHDAPPADEPRQQNTPTAFETLCTLVGRDKATRFCRAFVISRKVYVTERKYFVFANVIGASAAKQIIDVFDGELLTLPCGIDFASERRERDAAICAAHGKIPTKALAAISGLSLRHIKRIGKKGGRQS